MDKDSKVPATYFKVDWVDYKDKLLEILCRQIR